MPGSKTTPIWCPHTSQPLWGRGYVWKDLYLGWKHYFVPCHLLPANLLFKMVSFAVIGLLNQDTPSVSLHFPCSQVYLTSAEHNREGTPKVAPPRTTFLRHYFPKSHHALGPGKPAENSYEKPPRSHPGFTWLSPSIFFPPHISTPQCSVYAKEVRYFKTFGWWVSLSCCSLIWLLRRYLPSVSLDLGGAIQKTPNSPPLPALGNCGQRCWACLVGRALRNCQVSFVFVHLPAPIIYENRSKTPNKHQ